jgi:hypothetical protein
MRSIVGATILALGTGLGACSSDSTYSSVSLGVSSYGADDGYGVSARGDRDWDGIPNGFDRDRDGDGIPNRFDSRPNNPRWR